MFSGFLDESIIKKAQGKKLVKINIINLRDFAVDKRGTVDGRPFGGGAGMLIRVDVIDKALVAVQSSNRSSTKILLSPKGEQFTQNKAHELAKLDNITLLCGHYEGFDERVTNLIDEQISIGPFVLTGGEIAAAAIVDSVARLLPGVIKNESLAEESFTKEGPTAKSILEYPQYTYPREYKGQKVPEILLSGNHGEIERWKKENTSNYGQNL